MLVALSISIGNTLEALIGALLLKRLIDFKNSLKKLKDVLGLILLASLFSTAISATIGVSSLLLGNLIKGADFFRTWMVWWVGDLVSDLVIAPFILIWSQPFRIRFKNSLEFAALIVCAILTIGIIFAKLPLLETYLYPRAYIIFPILIWAALRFEIRGAVTTTFILSIASVMLTYFGIGPFAGPVLNRSLLSAQTFVSIMSISAMILAAIASERTELERKKDEFISIASHELKTPLTTIKGYSQILAQFLKKHQSETVHVYLAKMDEQISRLSKLINDLLNVSQIRSKKWVLRQHSFNIEELIKETVEQIQLTSKQKIIFETGDRAKRIWADKGSISEVLTNLISNAVKYSPRSDKIFVRLSSNRGVTVSIQDFGIGIAKKDITRIFQPFIQAETRIRQSFQGLGLGLYICSEIIRSHGGRIWIDSVKGKGTTISFSLPSR